MQGEFLQNLQRPRIDSRLQVLRERAKTGLDPAAPDETLNFLLALARLKNPHRILEIGSAEGLTSIALLMECPAARAVAIEQDEARFAAAKENFARFGVAERASLVLGDAADVLASLEGQFELIFLDGPKAQYVHWLPRLKGLLRIGGVLAADDVLLYGWVDGSVPVPYKRRSIAARLGEYLAAAETDEELETLVLRVGEGLAVSRKRQAELK